MHCGIVTTPPLGSCHPLFVLGPVSFVAITRALFLSQVNLIAQGAKKFPKYFELF